MYNPPLKVEPVVIGNGHKRQGHRILVTEPLGKEGLELLQQKADVQVRQHLSPDELEAIIEPYHALIVRSGTKVTASLLERAKQLAVVGRAGVGVDNIDVDAATRCGITVVNAPTTNIVAAAEHTIALLAACTRHIPQADRSLRAGLWERDKFTGTELVGKQLGLVGLGRVGGEVARRAIGLGIDVAAFDPYVTEERAQNMNVRLLSLSQLLASSDFISLHTPVTPETRHLLGAPEFAVMKKGAYLINAARGGLVDENALLDALDAGTLAGAALDVFDREPPDNLRLTHHDRVVLTPHIGGSTRESQVRVSREIAEQVLAVLEARPARFAVNAPLAPPALAPLMATYSDLAVRMGKFYIQWVGGPLGAVEIEYGGALAGEDTSILTASVIKGLLESIHEDRVNLVNAHRVAQMHGLKVSERRTLDGDQSENSIGIRGARRVAGSILHNQPHIIRLDDYAVDFMPEGYIVLTRHRDRPGTIGRVGTLLGGADINIASMQVARDAPRGEAIMVLSVDDPVPPPVLKQLREQLDVEWVQVVQL